MEEFTAWQFAFKVNSPLGSGKSLSFVFMISLYHKVFKIYLWSPFLKFGSNSISPVQWLSAPEVNALLWPGIWVCSSIEQGQSVLGFVDQQFLQAYPLVKPRIKIILIIFRKLGSNQMPLTASGTADHPKKQWRHPKWWA